MIRGLKGKVFKVLEDSLLIDTPGGVIYQVKAPYPYLSKLSEGDEVLMHIYTNFSQNGIELYGFENEEQLKVFQILLEIPGIGPVMALRILSDISIKELFEAVKTGNVSVLKRVKGLGTKKAEIIIFALRDVMWDERFEGQDNEAISESLQALVSLGLDYTLAKKLVSEAVKRGAKTSEEIIKFALQRKNEHF